MKVILILLTAVALTGCRYQSEFDAMQSLAEDKDYLEKNAKNALSNEKQLVIERYFSNIKELSHKLINDRRFSRNFHKRFFRYFNQTMCDDYVLNKEIWKTVLKTCKVNGFYLCAEELKHYQEILKLIPAHFTQLEIDNLKKDSTCNKRLTDLGVFNVSL
tara:strand:- start:806 stop:1285 length:480 start_codon:yes stop_codon:yes gene_type:complete